RILLVWMIGITQIFFSFSSFSQDSSAFTIAKDKLVKTLKERFIDKAYTESIDRFYFNTCDSLIQENVVIEDKPIRDILSKLFVASREKIKDGSINSLRIPAVNNYFLLTIRAYKKRPINRLYREIGVTQTAILQSAFDGLLLADSIKTIAGLREMQNFPFLVSTRINLPRYASYKDTLLYYFANDAPDILKEKLAEHDSLFTALVSKSHNRTVKVVSLLKDENDLDKVLPFGLAILEHRISADSVRELSLWPQDYYQAFVKEVVRLHKSVDPGISSYMNRPISMINKALANSYFIDEINMLHESPDKIRFQLIRTLTAKDLYFLLIGGSSDLYTSS
ncbi:MAG: hypothetical protein JJE22_08770, partial [Bacteroidia bacterium]|nr:hypothetical protein [Bacteroidia bacterium]